MTGRTHAVVGANAAWIAAFLGNSDDRVFLLAIAGAFAGILPDIDAGGAKIHHVVGGAFGAFRGVFSHRGFFHSCLAVAIVWAVSTIFLRAYHELLPAVVTLGYLSHLVIDGFNFKGTRYLFPWQREFHLVPKWLATPTGGFVDHIFMIAGLTGIVILLLEIFPLDQIPGPW